MSGIGGQLVLVHPLLAHVVACIEVGLRVGAVHLLTVSRPAPLACLAGVPRRHIPAAAETHVPVVEVLDVVEWGGLGVLG